MSIGWYDEIRRRACGLPRIGVRAALALSAALILPAGSGTSAAAQTPASPPSDARLDPGQFGYDDPNHPLKDPTFDPGHAWDNHRSADGTPDVLQAAGDWPWGELFYGKTYPTTLLVRNGCETMRSATIFVYNLPYLSIPSSVSVPPKSQVEVDVTITTPPAPNIIVTGREQIPPHGFYVDVGARSGRVVIWHPWGPRCSPNRETYTVTGHIHYEPPAADPGPQKIATPDPCEVYWNTGQRPPQFGASGQLLALNQTEDACTAKIRALAAAYVERVLDPHVQRHREAWSWLPGPGGIQQMSIEQLLAMKARAQLQLEGEK